MAWVSWSVRHSVHSGTSVAFENDSNHSLFASALHDAVERQTSGQGAEKAEGDNILVSL